MIKRFGKLGALNSNDAVRREKLFIPAYNKVDYSPAYAYKVKKNKE